MIYLALLAMALAEPMPPVGLSGAEPTVIRQSHSAPIPDEIAVALIPYIECKSEALNAEAERQPLDTGAKFLMAQVRAIESCAESRRVARSNSLALLDNSRILPERREAFVDQALLEVDHQNDYVAEVLDSHAPNR